MKLSVIINEAKINQKILKDPKSIKMLALAWRHDKSIPPNALVKLGPRPSDADIVNAYSDLLDAALSNTTYGDLSREGKFDEWLTRLYMNNIIDFEDISGEAIDQLGAWHALSIRGLLNPQDQDFNKFKSLDKFQKIFRNPEYQTHLQKIRSAEELEKHKRNRRETVLINDDRFYVIIPWNWGACYTFNNATGFNANFCTGGSQGLSWFRNYAPSGMIISVADKENINDVNGKWQMHAPTNQIVNALQQNRGALRINDQKFANLFPGLMKRIVDEISNRKDEIEDTSKEFFSPNGYNVEKEIDRLKTTFPISYASEAEPEQPVNQPTTESKYLKILREYAELVELLNENQASWWPAKKAVPKPATGGGPALVGQVASSSKPPAQKTFAKGGSYAINQLLKIGYQIKIGQGQNLLDTVDHLSAGLNSSLSEFDADTATKQKLSALLKSIINASENGNEKVVADEIEKLRTVFMNLMNTGHYDYEVKS